jgi:putative transposase
MTYSIDLREKAVSFVRSSGSKSEAVRIFNISRDTLYRWLNADDLRPKPSGLRHRKIDKAALKKHVEDHPDMFLHERAAIFGVHPSSISRTLKTLGIVKKRTRI